MTAARSKKTKTKAPKRAKKAASGTYIGKPKLSATHLQKEVIEHAVTKDYATKAGFYSAPAKDVQGLLNWEKPVRSGAFVVPYRGSVFLRAKLDSGKAKGWKVPTGIPVPFFRPPKGYPLNKGALYIAESPIKAAALSCMGFSSIGLGGVATVVKKDARRIPYYENPDVNGIKLDGRTVVIVFDEGQRTNGQVCAAMWRHAEALRARGAEVFYLCPPSVPGIKDAGIDDWLFCVGTSGRKHGYDPKRARAEFDKLERACGGDISEWFAGEKGCAVEDWDDNDNEIYDPEAIEELLHHLPFRVTLYCTAEPERGELVAEIAAVTGTEAEDVQAILDEVPKIVGWDPRPLGLDALELDPAKPLPAANRVIDAHFRTEGGNLKLVRIASGEKGIWYWRDPVTKCWHELPREHLDADLYKITDKAFYFREKKNEVLQLDFDPDDNKIRKLRCAMRTPAMLHMPPEGITKVWTKPHPEDLGDPEDWISLQNGLFNVTTGKLVTSHQELLFTLTSSPVTYDKKARCPLWESFLGRVLPDQESRRELQKIFYYILSGKTGAQVLFLFQGRPRTGKGTTMRVLEALVGPGNVTAPAIKDIGSKFGKESMIGKDLAICADVKSDNMRPSDLSDVVQFLSNVAGEDTTSVGRKYVADWIGKLRTRFVLVMNELVPLPDASGALKERLIYLSFPHKVEKEDRDENLTDKLLEELPGIFNWAMAGRNLYEKEGFRTPKAAQGVAEEMAEASFTEAVFREQYLRKTTGTEVSSTRIYAAFVMRCLSDGVSERDIPDRPSFGRRLQGGESFEKVRRKVDGKVVTFYSGWELVPERVAELESTLEARVSYVERKLCQQKAKLHEIPFPQCDWEKKQDPEGLESEKEPKF